MAVSVRSNKLKMMNEIQNNEINFWHFIIVPTKRIKGIKNTKQNKTNSKPARPTVYLF